MHIEVVRRLVEQQNVRLLQQQPREVHARLLSAGQAVEDLPALLCRNGEAIADLVRLRVHLIPAPHLKAVGKRIIFLQRLRARVLGHLGLQRAHLLFDLLQPGERRVQHIVHRISRRIVWDLRDEADLPPRCKAHLAGIVVDLARQNAEQRCLSRAVLPEQAHPLAGLHIKRDAVQNIRIRVKALDEVFYRDIDHCVSP